MPLFNNKITLNRPIIEYECCYFNVYLTGWNSGYHQILKGKLLEDPVAL